MSTATAILLLFQLGAAVLPDRMPEAAETHAVCWRDVEGEPLPFTEEEEILEFLRRATVVSSQPIAKGINKSLKLELERDGVRAHAVFRNVDKKYSTGKRTRWRHPIPFRDHHIFELAAYELSRELGLDRIPPVVARRIDGVEGTVQLWVEDAMDEERRRSYHLQPPAPSQWVFDKANMRVFDALIQNDDRNQGNLLIGPDWNVWLIDHTRSFSVDERLRDPESLLLCGRALWERLVELDEETVRRILGPYLDEPEMQALLGRLAKLVDHFDRRIEEQGALSILREEPERTSSCRGS